MTSDLKVYRDYKEFTRQDLNHCLQYFVAETRKLTGEPYPPRTLKGIIASIQLKFRNDFNKNWSLFHDTETSKK